MIRLKVPSWFWREYRDHPFGVLLLALLLAAGLAIDVTVLPEPPSTSPRPGVPPALGVTVQPEPGAVPLRKAG